MGAPDDEASTPPPTKEELMARLEALKERAEALRDRAQQQTRPSPATVALRVFLMFGVPILLAIVVFLLVGSILLAIGALVVGLVVTLTLALRASPASMKPGTRAFEAEHNARLLTDIIAARRTAQATAEDPVSRARLGREIEFLTKQREDNLAIAAANDGSPGKGYIGFEPYQGE